MNKGVNSPKNSFSFIAPSHICCITRSKTNKCHVGGVSHWLHLMFFKLQIEKNETAKLMQETEFLAEK